MEHISIDFETYSEIELSSAGAYRYINDPSFEILCFAYSIDFGEPQLWRPGLSIPDDFKAAMEDPGVKIHAYNAGFERYIIEKEYRQLGLSKPPGIKRYIDTQALVSYFSLPSSLERSGAALSLDIQKDQEGKNLMKLTKPKKWSNSKPWTRFTPENSPQEFKKLYEYCLRDVEAETAVLRALPKQELPPLEQKVWLHTVVQNQRGLYIDQPLVEQIIKVLTEWTQKQENGLAWYTKGDITSGGQVGKILKVIRDTYHPAFPDLKAETVDHYLNHPDTPIEIKYLLKFRQNLSRTSTAKFLKIMSMINPDNTVKDNLFYHAASTGRYGGRGFQMQNLPRAKSDNPEKLIEGFYHGLDYLEKNHGRNVSKLASQLVRSVITTPPGHDLFVSDFSSIECVVLHWLSRDERTLNNFRKGLDPYKVIAAAKYSTSYDQVTKPQRQHGKVMILGLGYQMGVNTYVSTAAGYGLDLTHEQAKIDVDFYRSLNKEVVQYWYTLYQTAFDAIKYNILTEHNGIRFGMKQGYLHMRLPSGRCIHYPSAEIRPVRTPWGEVKDQITYMTVDAYTKKWTRTNTTPGKLVENLDQGVSRDLLVWGAMNAERAGFKVVGSVHDEVLAYAPTGKFTIEQFNKTLCDLPPWAKDIPVKAEGYVSKRYKKE